MRDESIVAWRTVALICPRATWDWDRSPLLRQPWGSRPSNGNPLSHTAFAHIHPLPLITPHTSFTRCLTLLPSLPLPILDQADGDHHWEITLHVAR